MVIIVIIFFTHTLSPSFRLNNNKLIKLLFIIITVEVRKIEGVCVEYDNYDNCDNQNACRVKSENPVSVSLIGLTSTFYSIIYSLAALGISIFNCL